MIQIQKPKKKKPNPPRQLSQRTQARHCAGTRANAGAGGSTNAHRPAGKERGRPQPQHWLDATNSKIGGFDKRTGISCGRAGSSRRACGKETSTRKRRRPAVEPAAPSISEPVPVSLSVAQSMAITAPLPDYRYEMKRRNLTGSGVCVVTVDTATGTVTNATMFQSTGSPLLDKLTIQTFKNWRFKPGTVSEVRVPISYE